MAWTAKLKVTKIVVLKSTQKGLPPRTRMLATTVDFLKESGQVLLVMTGPPLRCDIVNIGLHFFLKDVRPMLPPVMNRSIVDA